MAEIMIEARDLRPGDVVKTLRGWMEVGRVVEDEGVMAVYEAEPRSSGIWVTAFTPGEEVRVVREDDTWHVG